MVTKISEDNSSLYFVWKIMSDIPGWLGFLGRGGITESRLTALEMFDDEIRSMAHSEEERHDQWLRDNLPKNHEEALLIFPEARGLVKKSVWSSGRGYFTKIGIEEANSSDIVEVVSSYVKLKRVGSRFVGICPFHHERHPSFTIYLETNSFHCFGCSAHGGTISFLMKIENLSFKQAVRVLLKAKDRV